MGKRKAKMGRPPKRPAEKMSKRAIVAMTPADYRRLSAEARGAGVSRAAVLLKAWKRGAKR